jgi:hypothetical protein
MLHHPDRIAKEMRRMRILFGIAESVMHPVQHRVRSGYQKRRTLRNGGEQIKEALGTRRENEHSVGAIAVEKERLAK